MRRPAARPRREPRHVRLRGLSAAASFFQGYDLNMVMVAPAGLRRAGGAAVLFETPMQRDDDVYPARLRSYASRPADMSCC